MAPLTASQRLKEVREALEKRIDFDLGHVGVEPVQVDFHVLDRFSSYLSFRTAEMYRLAAVILSFVVAAATLINVLVQLKV